MLNINEVFLIFVSGILECFFKNRFEVLQFLERLTLQHLNNTRHTEKTTYLHFVPKRFET